MDPYLTAVYILAPCLGLALLLLCACLVRLSHWKAACSVSRSQIDDASQRAAEERIRAEGLSARLLESEKKLSAAQERELSASKRLESFSEEAQKAHAKLLADFENLSAKVYDAARAKFSSANREQLDLILTPLKSDLKNFEKKVEAMNLSQAEKGEGLSAQIRFMGELNARLSKDAQNLTEALKGQNKTAGNWGEMVLTKLLDSCGLSEGREYVCQTSLLSEDGGRFMPDVIINLPQERHIVVDSKASLLSYLKYASAENEAQRATAFDEFSKSVKAHVKGLSEKDYSALEGIKSPDFVMMFIPIEPAFSLLMKEAPEIFDAAFAKKIVICAPSTLLAILKTVESVWRSERQTRNTAEIARLGASVYAAVERFVKAFEVMGDRIKKLNTEYDNSVKALTHGKGNLIVTARKLEKLGVKIKDRIDDGFAEEADASEEEDISES